MVEESRCWMPMSMPDSERYDVVIERGEGIYLFDTNGKKYIDGNSGLWNMPLGYSNSIIKQAIIMQLDKLPYANSELVRNNVAEDLAEKIINILGEDYSKVLLNCTGSECVEAAIKIVRKYNSVLFPSKKQIGVFSNSYHGTYYGAMSATEYGKFMQKGYGPFLEGFINLGDIYEIPENKEEIRGIELKSFEKEIIEQIIMLKEFLGAIIIEPVQASAGLLCFSTNFMNELFKVARENNILIVFDEIATGFGRTGIMFSYLRYGVKPDILLMSKGINNGYLPLGAVGVKKTVTDLFNDKKLVLNHFSTQNTNPVCCISAIETIEQLCMDDYKIIKETRKVSEYFLKELQKIKNEIPIIREIRTVGMCFALDLGKGTPITLNQLDKLIRNLRDEGVLSTASTCELHIDLIFFLPFIINKDELDVIIKALKRSLKNITI